ncbi:MAG: DUF4238 domain-containing protein [Deltaproteobacteria bacterium]|nr:DUF4238 domain-containing protein [Deltaproteobacteria bacterium]
MSTQKRHHYLSEFYLKEFSEENRIWVYDRETKKLRRDIPKNTAVKTNYYTITDEEGERSTEAESVLSLIEDRAVGPIKKLDKKEIITYEEKQELSLFIALFITRVPHFERVLIHMFDTQAKTTLKVASATKERVDHLVSKYNIELNDFDHTDFMEYVKSEKNKIVPNHELVIAYMLKMGLEIAKYLFQMDWFILHSTDDQPLATTDVPFVILAPKDQKPPYRYGVGLIQKDTVKLIPLTKNTALAMVNHGDRLIHRDFNSEQVTKLNEIMALSSERLLIGPDRELISSIIEHTHLFDMEPNQYVSIDSFGDSIQGFITVTTLNVDAYNSSWLGSLIE